MQNRQTRISVRLLCTALVWPAGAILAADLSPRGIVRDDAQWAGEITIAEDVSISGAEVRVEAGSTIRFVSRPGATSGPAIRLQGPTLSAIDSLRPTRLLLAGTPDRPIVIESGPDGPPGAIASARDASGSIVGRHVVFRRLGSASAAAFQPAILLQLSSPHDDLWLTDCRFERCGPLCAEFIGAGGSADVSRCVFSDSPGPTALVLLGTGTGIKVVRGNFADAGFQIGCPQVLVEDNVLMGDSAAIAVGTVSITGVTVAGNYVHCTASHDTGRYALKCDAPDVVVADNVLVGGTYVIETAPRTVRGNVLIGVSGLRPTFRLPGVTAGGSEAVTTTHSLIADAVPGAVISGNLLLGPAYAAVTTGERADRPRIEHNLFDGWDQARRAVEFNVLARKSVGATFTRNVVMHYRQAPVIDGTGPEGTLADANGNIFAEVAEPVYGNVVGLEGLGRDDLQLDTVADLHFAGIPAAATQAVLDVDRDLRNGRLRVADLRRMWFDAYRPRPDSPLVTTRPAGPWSASAP